MFSRRTDWDLTPNVLSEARRRLESRGSRLLDLTESNPTRAGVDYPDGIFQALSDRAVSRYEPDPRGLEPARQAVARLFSGKGAVLSADRILLTAGTSEAYTYLFRLLADPGQAVLVPRPSYPLFQYLAQLSDVETISYPLHLLPREGWRVDFDGLESAAEQGAKAVVVVHPNNPTGSALRREELERLAELCRRREMALIADEVFAEYFHDPNSDLPKTLLGEYGILVFALGGLSKFLGLPQMKLAWTACSGPPSAVESAFGRLEVIADSFLSVNTPAQNALPRWLDAAGSIQAQIRRRLGTNLRFLEDSCGAGEWRLLPVDGGWSAVLKNSALNGWEKEERCVLSLLENKQVMVYPGSFFDFDEPGHLVLSLLTEPAVFSEGITRLIQETS